MFLGLSLLDLYTIFDEQCQEIITFLYHSLHDEYFIYLLSINEKYWISYSQFKYSSLYLGFFDEILKTVSSSERPLLIFPQGTRVLPEDKPKFKKGTGRIYEALKIKCQPVAINSGYVWPKNKPLKSNKIITISILKSIEPGLAKEEFLNILENNIYSELDKMNYYG